MTISNKSFKITNAPETYERNSGCVVVFLFSVGFSLVLASFLAGTLELLVREPYLSGLKNLRYLFEVLSVAFNAIMWVTAIKMFKTYN